MALKKSFLAILMVGVSLFMCVHLLASQQKKHILIGVIPAGSGVGFWDDVRKGAQAAGKELGIQIYFRGPSDESNTDGQKDVITILKKKKMDALVLAPSMIDSSRIVNSLKKEGIPTIYIDRDAEGSDVHSVIATDNYRAGKAAAYEIAKKLGKGGKVILFREKKGVPSTDAREEGFLDGANERGVVIVADKYLGTSIGTVRTNAESVLRAVGDFEGIFAPNESTSVGVLVALEKLGIENKIFIGFDSSVNMINALRKGTMYGFIVQQPFRMGYLGVKTAYAVLQGKPVQGKIECSIKFISRENIHEPEVKQLLHIKE